MALLTEALIRIGVDKAALNTARTELAKTDRALDKTAQSGEKLAETLQSDLATASRGGKAGLKELAKQASETAGDIEIAQRKIQSANREQVKGGAVEAVGAGSTLGGALASVAGALPGGQTLSLVGDLLGAVESLGQFKDTIGQFAQVASGGTGIIGKLGGALGTVISTGLGAVLNVALASAPALAVFAAGITLIQSNMQDAVTAFAGAVKAFQEVQVLIATGTSEDAKAQLTAAEQELKAARASRDAAQRILTETERQTNLGVFTGLVAGVFGAGGVLEDARKTVTESNAAIAENEAKITQLNAALQQNAFAANDTAQAELALLQARLAQNKEYIDAEANLTADAIRARIAQYENERKAIEQTLANTDVAKLTGESLKAYEDAQKRQKELTDSIYYYTEVLLPAKEGQEGAANAALATAQKTRDAIQEYNEGIKLSSDAAKQRIEALQQSIAADVAARDSLLESGNTSEAVKKQIEEYNRAIDDNDAKLRQLTEQIIPVIEAREKEAAAAEKLKGALRDLPGLLNGLLSGPAKLLEEMLRQAEARNTELANTARQYTEDVQAIEEKSAEERADIQERYNERLADAAQAFAEAQKEALASLLERRAELARDFGRDELNAQRDYQLSRLDAQIEFQRQEAQAAVDLARRIEDIRRDAARREQDLILNRDFAGLFASRLDTTNAISDAQRDANREREDRARAFADQQADAARAFEQERAARLRQYQQNLIDAQAAYEQERAQNAQRRTQALAQARNDYNRELQEQQAATNRQLAARRGQYERELQQASLYAYQREAIYKREQETFLKIALETLSKMTSGASGKTTTRAFGGQLSVGQAALVNDRYPGQRESFNGVPFPPGLGTFIPAVSGRVDAGGRSASPNVTLTFNVTGAARPEVTAQAIRGMVVEVLGEVFD